MAPARPESGPDVGGVGGTGRSATGHHHHSDIVRQRLLRVGFGPVERAVCRRAALVLSGSLGYVSGSSLLQQLGDKVRVLPFGLDLRPYQEPTAAARAYAAELRAAHPGPVWLSVGRLTYYKGLHVALAALRQVPGTLVVCGTGPLGNDLKQQAAALGVADRACRVRDYGRVDLRLAPTGDIYVIEVNASCYLEPAGEFATAAKEHGLDYPTVINRIADLAVERHKRGR